ncbi:copper homeostasis periplasmic binding protein CopC [Burkholderia pseudomallei]|uniref:copper homeostasis periplasmic binding protein CopC n=1 Tax=Burkholderia pseudomallei TaxID=28450 RepID=UPI0003FF3CF9|nr:copper homeostasis periplasmic binding protein CopC [Burkholderia pseudomallei]OMW97869.1 copper resistance protein CopC [Burkholderia pseudomallei]OMY04430.1 copper resistance protein CopC [Burkholderia pseudomallei]OMY05711.1 copper resistance protein CopC [Burkholderia pseudomallei]OMY23803.1 copper resistance protein CopC [Burkholderia pseudomallei]OMY29871.1 copper resistance protein CopC [Burkholderia pseudomallei]
METMKRIAHPKRAGLAALVAACAAIASAAAFAHGKLESAVPAPGGTVDTAPDALRLTFNESLESAFSTVKIANAGGAPVAAPKAKVDAANPRVLTLAVPKLAPGAYTVQWTVMTADAHKTKGSYAFKVK